MILECKKVATVLGVLFVSLTGGAIENIWLPTSGTNDWSDAANWSLGHVPGADASEGVNSDEQATIPKETTGVINYDKEGPVFSNLYYAANNGWKGELTLNVNAPMHFLISTDGFAVNAKNFRLNINAGGSMGVTNVLLKGVRGNMNNLYAGCCVIERGGAIDTWPEVNSGWQIKGYSILTNRGDIVMRWGRMNGSAGNNTMGVQGTFVLDGGSVNVAAVKCGASGGKLFILESGGVLQTIAPSTGIRLGGDYDTSYNTQLVMDGGVITNRSTFVVGENNVYVARTGTGTAVLRGGFFKTYGSTDVGSGRVGEISFEGTTYESHNDLYIGGGCAQRTTTPVETIAVSGMVSVVSGVVSFTNTPRAYSLKMVNYNSNTKRAKFTRYSADGGDNETIGDRRVRVTDVTGGLTNHFEVGSVHCVSYPIDGMSDRFLFLTQRSEVTDGSPVIRTNMTSNLDGIIYVETMPSVVSVGNIATFTDGTRLAPGVLNVIGGTLNTDLLIATNGSASVVNFTGGTLNLLEGAMISNGVPFTVGDGSGEAVFGLSGTASFANGLAVADQAVLAPGGVGKAGSVAIAGDVSFAAGATLRVDVTAETNDTVEVTGAVTLAKDFTVMLDVPAGVKRDTFVLLRASGGIGGAFKGVHAEDAMNGERYWVSASEGVLTAERIPHGLTLIVH